MPGTDRGDGVYIELFHGRVDPSEDMEDWGERGPVFGPFRFVHTTYASDIKFGTEADTPQHLSVLDDVVHYDAMCYGDWSVFPASTFRAETDLQRRHQAFDAQKATIPDNLRRKLEHER